MEVEYEHEKKIAQREFEENLLHQDLDLFAKLIHAEADWYRIEIGFDNLIDYLTWACPSYGLCLTFYEDQLILRSWTQNNSSMHIGH